MEPNSFGRKLGISVRVVARIAKERAADASRATPAPVAAAPSGPARMTADVAAKTRSLANASRKFSQAVWGPTARVGAVLWLEITGLFFALFTLFFTQNVYRLRHAYQTGPDHQRFLLYCGLTLVFAYFTLSSFYRARRKERKKIR